MRAVITQGHDGLLEVADIDDPVPQAGELLVRVTACGICGSDLHISDALPVPGVVLGHEFSAEVVEVGPGVDAAWRVGDRLAGFPLTGCGTCEACRTGRTSKCASAAQHGLHRPGAFAEYVTLPATSAFRLPASIDATRGALVEPLAVAHHALALTPAVADRSVLILGGGPVGAAVALWARHLGARDVVVTDPVAQRRHLAETVGATATIDPATTDVAGEFDRLTGTPAGIVIECVGVPGLIQHAIDVAAADAHVTVVGVCIPPDQISPLVALHKELALQFVLYYPKASFDATIAALDRDQLVPDPLVTGHIGLDDLPGRFAALKQPTTDCKVIVQP